MRLSPILLFLLTIQVSAAPLNVELRTPEVQEKLDELTRSPETMNHVTLLERGMNSWPARLALVNGAEHFVFISVPFWYNDRAGRHMVEALSERKRAARDFELKVIQGWTSPFLSKGGLKIRSALKDISDQYLLWNSPFWLRRFSFQLLRGHLHDKFLIVDGRKMILGGMNISEEDAGGGVTPQGTHDVDLQIEGPAVHQATEIFLKLNQLGHHLRSSESFPPFKEQEIKAFQDYFYENKEDHDFWTVTDEPNPKPPFRKRHRVHIPIRSLLANSRYFPSVGTGPVGLRLIYDNPLIDRDPRTKRHYSKFFRTLAYLAQKTRQTLWITTPYLTFDRELMELFLQASERLDVRIVTNSLGTSDRDKTYYKAQLSHYPAMLKAGIRVYEWKGQDEMLKVDKECRFKYWPGQMLHSKLVLLDGSVAFVGSNNINRRSKSLNNEVMALVNDEEIARRLNEIFQKAFNGEKQAVECSNGPRDFDIVELMTEARVKKLVRELKVKKPVWNYPFGGM